MARTARDADRKTTRARLLTAVAAVAACASAQAPPGGPFDPAPPTLLTITPDSGSEVVGFDDAVEFAFDEVINEGTGTSLQQLFTVSPRHETIRVRWRRSRITVRPTDGWRDSIAYRVALLPGITDLRNNRLDSSRTVVFSTGGPIPTTRVTGTVVDWEAGRIAQRGLVEAVRVPDSLTYWTVTDSTGAFELTAVAPGTYRFVGVVDGNNDRRHNVREPFDSLTLVLDSTIALDLWAFQHDTVGPRIANVNRLDSTHIGIDFNQMLGLSLPPPDAFRVLELPDSVPLTVTRVLGRPAFDSLAAETRRVADSLRADSLARAAAAADTLGLDTLAAPADTAAPDPVPADTAGPLPVPGQPGGDSIPTGPSQAELLLAQRPPLFNTLVLQTRDTLQPGGRYVVEATAINIYGATETSLRILVIPEPPPVPRDTS